MTWLPCSLVLSLTGSCGGQELITIFNDLELELLISGLPEIDVGDLRANTEYSGYAAASRVIQWFWECVDEMGKQDRALLVQFVTGTSKVQLDGFRGLQVRGSPSEGQTPGERERGGRRARERGT